MEEKYLYEKNKLKFLLNEVKIYDILKKYKCYLAGGTITSIFCRREINDFDIYFRCLEDVKQLMNEYPFDCSSLVSVSKKGILVKIKDTLIHIICFRSFLDPDELLNSFDFTACMGVYDFETENFVLHPDFLRANSQKVLVFNEKTAFPIMSAIRVNKYREKGYIISKEEHLRIIIECMRLNIKTSDELKNHIGGMYGDVNYDEILTPEEGENFSLSSVSQKMKNIASDPRYFSKKIPRPNIYDMNLLIDCVCGKERKLIKFRDDIYSYDTGFHKITRQTLPVKLEELTLSEYFKDDPFIYKNVKLCEDGTIHSFFNPEFEYKIGEIAIGRGERISLNNDAKIGIFGYKNLLVARDGYRRAEPGRVILKMYVDWIDVIEISDSEISQEIEIKKATPVEVIDPNSIHDVNQWFIRYDTIQMEV